MRSHLNSILQIGDRPDDPHNVVLMHHFLVAMGVFMSFGGLIWGSMSLAFGLTLQSLISYAYAPNTEAVSWVSQYSFTSTRSIRIAVKRLVCEIRSHFHRGHGRKRMLPLQIQPIR